MRQFIAERDGFLQKTSDGNSRNRSADMTERARPTAVQSRVSGSCIVGSKAIMVRRRGDAAWKAAAAGNRDAGTDRRSLVALREEPLPRKSRSARKPVAKDVAPGRQRSGSVRALDRGLALLEIIAEADGLHLTKIAQRAGVAASTAHRILATLKANDFVLCDEAHGGWFIGVKAFKIGSAFLRNRKLVDAGRSVMRDLLELSGETVNLGIEDKGDVVFVAQFESHHSIRAFHRPGSRGTLHASSLGKAILAELPPAEVLRNLHRAALRKFTDRTIVDPEALLRDLAVDRPSPFAIDGEIAEQRLGVDNRAVGEFPQGRAM